MKAVKYVLYAIGGVVALAVVAALALSLLVDANQFKGPIERAVKDATQRTLVLEGSLHLTFFPSVGLSTGKATLSARNSDARFASLQSAQVSVDVLPLLHRALVVNAVRIDGLHVDLVRYRDGRSNYADLLPAPAAARRPAESKAAARPAAPLKLDVSSIRVERAAISYRDEKSGRSYAISDLDLRTGRIAPEVPGKLSLAATLKGTNPDVDAKLQLSGGYRFSPRRAAYDVSDLRVEARGTLARQPFEMKLAAPRLAMVDGRASAAQLNGTLRLEGAGRKTEAGLKLAGIEGSVKALRVAQLVADFDAPLGSDSVKGELSSPLHADLARQDFALSKLALRATLSGPKLPRGKLALALSGHARAELAKHEVSAQLAGEVDASKVEARVVLAPLAPLHTAFDVAIDRLDLDRYLGTSSAAGSAAPPPEQAAGKRGAETRLDFSPLKALNAQGQLRIGALTVHHLKLADVKAQLRAADGRLAVSPYSARLYQGSLTGALALEAHGNRVALKDTLGNVSIGPLLRDLTGRDALEGRGNVALDVTGAGASVEALKKSLAGSASVHLRNGAIKGINLAATLRKAQALLGAQSAQEQAADQTQQTDFSELSASFAIRNGVARNDDLQLKSPFFRVGGAGDIDLGASRLDYLAKATVVASAQGQGGPELAKLRGLTVPVRLSGPFDAVKYRIDLAAMASELAKSKLREKLQQKLQGTPNQGGAGGEVQKLLKGIFGR